MKNKEKKNVFDFMKKSRKRNYHQGKRLVYNVIFIAKIFLQVVNQVNFLSEEYFT